MPSPLTIKKYIAKTKKQIKDQRKKLRYSKHPKQRLDAREEIPRLESKLLYFEQSLIFEQAKHYEQRDKEANRTQQQHDVIKELPGCDQVGAGADTASGDDRPW